MTTETPAMTLGPRGHEHPQDAGWSLLGVLGGTTQARIDRGGLVTPAGSAGSVDWWIGAGDRWYLPAREPTTRQTRLGPGPVIETTMKIGPGNARHTAWGALVGGQEATVVEITNDSPEPVVLALALRPYTVDGPDGSGGQGLHGGALRLDGRRLLVGDEQLLALPRQPAAAGASSSGDLLATVTAGGELDWVGPTSGPDANAVVVLALPHRATLRFCVGAAVDPAAAPAPDTVVKGWRSVIDAAAGFQFPDPGLTQLMDAARARLLLCAPGLGRDLARLAPGAGAALAGLAAGGHRSEVRAAIEQLGSSFPSRLGGEPLGAAEIVAALAPAVAASLPTVPPWLLETGAQLTHLVERSGDRPATSVAMRGLAHLSALAGDDDGAAHLAHLASLLGADDGSTPGTDGIDEVSALAAEASPVGSWGRDDSPATAAHFVVAARALLADDTGSALVILPEMPPSWRGAGAEVTGAPTMHGQLSYAIRWHGYRPALLWQLEPGVGPTAPVLLRCPGLDPDWSTAEPRGEALLAGSADGLPTPPAEGESFL